MARKLLAESHRVASYARSLTQELKDLAAHYPNTFLSIQGDVYAKSFPCISII